VSGAVVRVHQLTGFHYDRAMASLNSFGTRTALTVGGETYQIYTASQARDAITQSLAWPDRPRRRRLTDQRTTELEHRNALELLVATILSAQSTDKKVNEITGDLFRKYRGPEDYLAVPEEELQADIYQSGFFRQKTRSIRGMCQALLERHGGQVPLRMRDLIALPGVARKTANVVLGAAAPEAHRSDPDAGIAVDTHVKRVSRRLAFTRHTDPDKIEGDLMRLWPKEEWAGASLSMILHGRRVCDALRPRCGSCMIEELCPSSLAAGLSDKAGQARGLGA
jgi:endonuclease III